MKNIKPIDARILVRMTPENKTSSKGIILSEEVDKDKPKVGEIVAVAADANPDLIIGKKVLFLRSAFNRIVEDGYEYYFLIEEDILGIYDH